MCLYGSTGVCRVCVNPWKCWNVFMDLYEHIGVRGSMWL